MKKAGKQKEAVRLNKKKHKEDDVVSQLDSGLVPSPRCLHIAESGAEFAARLHVTLDAMTHEYAELRSLNLDRADRRISEFQSEWGYILAIVKTMSETTAQAWERLRSESLSPVKEAQDL